MTAANSGSTGLVDRYASALFSLADAAKKLDATAADLASIDGLVRETPALALLLRSPVVTRAAQGRALDAVLRAAGVGDLARRFVGVVAENRRLVQLPAIITAFQRLVAERRGETQVEVISSRTLSAAQQDALTRALQQAVGGAVALSVRTDAGLLGGLVVKIGSRMVDYSLRTKLQRLSLAIKGIG